MANKLVDNMEHNSDNEELVKAIKRLKVGDFELISNYFMGGFFFTLGASIALVIVSFILYYVEKNFKILSLFIQLIAEGWI